ncbi:MAG: hypothetical protein A2Y40_03425 [Candidatus Margulisbacteria bacterium GWF2_35_9]|nr:MAG: hypothetical protein A2Y40_03425 [Candidatus Margulisbacteria bacterium GWF2_35_9]
MADLPMIPEKFKTSIRKDEGSSNQYKVIKSLLEREDIKEVICATDAGREGELIFRFIYRQARCKKPIKRLWISSMTDKAIQDGFASLKNGDEYQKLYDSALSRSESDWMVGLNATRAYTCKFSNGQGVLSVGRVQTPVLKMIVDRYQKNSEFKPSIFYEILATINHANGTYTAKWINSLKDKETRLLEKDKAELITTEIKQTKTGMVKSVDGKQKNEKQPLLYDLTSLQKDGNKWFKLSADDTLNIMQNLYQTHKLLTYPRTSSKYVTSDMAPTLPKLIENLKNLPDYKSLAESILDKPLKITSRIVDDKKVDDHHAIIPTDKVPNRKIIEQLSASEKQIYDIVIRRFLAVFFPECIKNSTEVISEFGEHLMITKGMIIQDAGWRIAYQTPDIEVENEDDEENTTIPKMENGDNLTIEESTLKEGKTKAPPLHTESTILSLMETAGKQIDDEDLREALKDCGLGTPATRAAIIETLIKRNYVERQKNKLIPTDKGIGLISVIQDDAFLSPELTGQWEKKLNEIVKGDYSRSKFMDEIKELTLQVVANVKNIKNASTQQKEYKVPVVGKCPQCETGDILAFEKAFGCSNYRSEGCSFTIWKTIAGKEIDIETATELVSNKKTGKLSGFQSKKTGKTFEAKLVLVDNKVQLGFD